MNVAGDAGIHDAVFQGGGTAYTNYPAYDIATWTPSSGYNNLLGVIQFTNKLGPGPPNVPPTPPCVWNFGEGDDPRYYGYITTYLGFPISYFPQDTSVADVRARMGDAYDASCVYIYAD